MKPISQQSISASDLAKNAAAQKLVMAKVDGEQSKTSKSGPTVSAAVIADQGPPVDMKKITAIRTAIAEGSYPVDPEKIAEQMIALDLLSGADQ